MPSLTQIPTTQERAVLRAFRQSIQSVRGQAVIQEIVRLLVATIAVRSLTSTTSGRAVIRAREEW